MQPISLWRQNEKQSRTNEVLKPDKVPLGDNRGATHGKLYLRSLIQLGLMYPPFWFSMLESKIGYAHITGRNSRSTTLESLVLSPKVPSQKQIRSLFSWFSQHPPQKTACLCTALCHKCT